MTRPATRAQLRKDIRQRRKALPPEQRRTYDAAIVAHLAGTTAFRNSKHIGLYLANDGEVDLSALAELASALGKTCYLPVLGIPFHNRLWFTPYRLGEAMALNRFGIPEPLPSPHRRARKVWALDLLLTPLVAFDDEGNRLGMGGGFYDRTLGYRHLRHTWRKPRVVGVAYELQRVSELATQPWDVGLDGIATEKGIRSAAPAPSLF